MLASLNGRREDYGALVAKDRHSCISHCEGCLGNSVQTFTSVGIAVNVIGVGVFRHTQGKAVGVVGKQKPFGSGCRAQSAQSVRIIDFHQAATL